MTGERIDYITTTVKDACKRLDCDKDVSLYDSEHRWEESSEYYERRVQNCPTMDNIFMLRLSESLGSAENNAFAKSKDKMIEACAILVAMINKVGELA